MVCGCDDNTVLAAIPLSKKNAPFPFPTSSSTSSSSISCFKLLPDAVLLLLKKLCMLFFGGLLLAMLKGKDTKKSDEATILFVGEVRFNGGNIGGGDNIPDGSVECDNNDGNGDDEEDGTMTITLRAVPVAKPKGAECGGGNIMVLEESMLLESFLDSITPCCLFGSQQH